MGAMFCYQCQETVKNSGCTMAGVCGKNSEVAGLQDMMVYLFKGIALWAEQSKKIGLDPYEADVFIMRGLFTTVTNVNFDPKDMEKWIHEAMDLKEKIQKEFLKAYLEKNKKEFEGKLPEPAYFNQKGTLDFYSQKGYELGVLADKDESIRSLKWLLIYGLKGMAAYADHAFVLSYADGEILSFMHEALALAAKPEATLDDLLNMVVKTGEYGVKTMALLDRANTTTYGDPEPTEVFTGTKKGPGILVSGHDLLDFYELLEQTKDKGVNIYTHGEMLPANAYPAFKKYRHLVGNFGTSWYNQQAEFEDFKGAILMTTNCLQKPRESYKNKIFSTGLVGWPDMKSIENRKPGKQKDFSALIQSALDAGDIGERPGKKITVGFARNTLDKASGAIVEAVKSGKIKRFVVMGGCDGRYKEREYYTQVAEQLPEDTVILTAGCAKYRYNMLDLGEIGGIPRVIDAGQCNDSYSLAVTALKLAEAFKAESINDLPISFDIAWYEQKAVVVLLALLYLGVQGIRLGPTIPAFVTQPNILNLLVEKFKIRAISSPSNDVALMMQGK